MGSGTATKTGVPKETGDLDYAYAAFRALPDESVAVGTKMFKDVRAEDAKKDCCQSYFHTSRC